MIHRGMLRTAVAHRCTAVVFSRRALLAPRLSLGQCLDLVPVQGGRLRIVSLLDRLVLLPVRLVVKELLGPLIAAHLHLGQFNVLPLVHCHGTNERQMHAETTVLATALEADPDTICHGHPLRVMRPTFEASLEAERERERGS